MKPYQFNRTFTVQYRDVDFNERIKISSLLALMGDAAGASADELGFGSSYVKPKGYTFMIANTYLECEKPIKVGQTVCLKTWPLPPSRAIFNREYIFLDEQETPLVKATSRWCLVDVENGKIIPSKAIENQDYSTYNTQKVVENVQWKIPAFSLDEGECKFTLTISNSEYDYNMHVNNTRYADYCLNCFSVAQLQAWSIKKFAISYVKQCHEGDVLRFYRKRLDDKSYLVQGVNEQNEIVVQSHVEFQEN